MLHRDQIPRRVAWLETFCFSSPDTRACESLFGGLSGTSRATSRMLGIPSEDASAAFQTTSDESSPHVSSRLVSSRLVSLPLCSAICTGSKRTWRIWMFQKYNYRKNWLANGTICKLLACKRPKAFSFSFAAKWILPRTFCVMYTFLNFRLKKSVNLVRNALDENLNGR